MTLIFDVLRDDPPRLVAAGWMVLVCVDRKTLKPQPLPAGLVEALTPHTLTTAAARAILGATPPLGARPSDRKSTRLNSSHLVISYAVFCLKKKRKTN